MASFYIVVLITMVLLFLLLIFSICKVSSNCSRQEEAEELKGKGLISENLDTRICDFYGNYECPESGLTEETFREFINRKEKEEGVEPVNIDELTEDEIHSYMSDLDWLSLK